MLYSVSSAHLHNVHLARTSTPVVTSITPPSQSTTTQHQTTIPTTTPKPPMASKRSFNKVNSRNAWRRPPAANPASLPSLATIDSDDEDDDTPVLHHPSIVVGLPKGDETGANAPINADTSTHTWTTYEVDAFDKTTNSNIVTIGTDATNTIVVTPVGLYAGLGKSPIAIIFHRHKFTDSYEYHSP